MAQSMFRNTADHNGNYAAVEGVFNDLAWKFDAGAPVRSTVAVANGSLYFGSSRGIFYSLNKNSGKINWTFKPGHAVNSSAAYHNGNVFFSDNGQSLYALNASTGKQIWKLKLGTSKDYEWAFDYFYSSPTIIDGQILIGSKDGSVYNVSEKTGKINWTFKTGGIVRSSPAVAGNTVYVGDTEGTFFAIDLNTGKQKWSFEIEGNKLKNENFGFDRRAIIASPVVTGNKVIFGGRDGFLYALDKTSGKQLWRVDHEVSWIISAVAVKDSFVVTGTSDGRFVQAVNLNTGNQIWKFHAVNVVWSSPVLCGDKVYVGSHEGQLYCLDLKTGEKISSFKAGDIIFSSPVIADNLLYFGSDDGYLYALRPGKFNITPKQAQKYVFWDQTIPSPNNGNDIRIKRYLVESDYKVLNQVQLIDRITKKDSASNSVIVFATNFFPDEITKGGTASKFRKYLDSGGKIVMLGTNPLILRFDEKEKAVVIRNFLYPDTVAGIKYGPNDLRSYKGNQPAFATSAGSEWGIKKFWTAPLSVLPNQVDIVLGMDENGLASAWVKKFSNDKGSGLVQIWAGEGDRDLSFITKVAEYGLK